MVKNNLTLGSDPEVFILNTKLNKIVSVENLIKNELGEGTKQNPLKLTNGFSLQEDNALAEYNIPPCKTISEWVDAHNYGITAINAILPDYHKVVIETSAYLDWEELGTAQTMEAGCEKDINVYTLNYNDSPDLSLTNLRVAGGHVHIGFENKTEERMIKLVKSLDYFLGVPSLLLDSDTKRRELYGKAGCFREKDFGIEYRTLSNFWLKDESLMKWVFNQVHVAYENMNRKLPDVQHIIDNNLIEEAKKLTKVKNKIWN